MSNNISYLPSKYVKIFPCTYRGYYAANEPVVPFDIESRLASEYNFTHLPGISIGDTYIYNYTIIIAGQPDEIKSIKTSSDFATELTRIDRTKVKAVLLEFIFNGYAFKIDMAKDLTAETDETFSDALDILLDANFAYLVTKQAPLVSTNSADAARTLQYLAPLPALVARNDYMSLISNNTADRQLPDVDMVSLDERIPVTTPSTPVTPVVPETPPAEQVVPIDDAEPDAEPDSEVGDTGDSSGGTDTDTETDDDAANVAARYRCIAIGFVSGEALNLTPVDVTTTATDEINFIDSFSSWNPHTLDFNSAASWRDNLIVTRPDLDAETDRAEAEEAALSQALSDEQKAREKGDDDEAKRINARIGLASNTADATVGGSTEDTLIAAVDAELNRVVDEHLALAKKYSNSRLGEIKFDESKALTLTQSDGNISDAVIELTLPVTKANEEPEATLLEEDTHPDNTLRGTTTTKVNVKALAGQLQDVAVISEAKTNEQTNEQPNEWQLKFTWNAAADNKTDIVALKEIVRPEFFTTTPVLKNDGSDQSGEGIPFLSNALPEINTKFKTYFAYGTGLFADGDTQNPQIRVKIDPTADVYTTYDPEAEKDFEHTPYLQITTNGLKLTGINQRVGELNDKIKSNILTVDVDVDGADNKGSVFNVVQGESPEDFSLTKVDGAKLVIEQVSEDQLKGKKLKLILPKYITTAELETEINNIFSAGNNGGGFNSVTGLYQVIANKADKNHDHDGIYSKLGHTHTSLSNDTNTIEMPAKSGTIALTTDIPAIPTELPNPNKLTIAYGNTSVDYDGSAAKSITINASSIGAAESTHTHNYASATHTHAEYAEKNHDHDDYVTADYLTEHNYVTTVYLTGQNYVTSDFLTEQLKGKQANLGITSIGNGLALDDETLTVVVSTADGNSLLVKEDGLFVQLPQLPQLPEYSFKTEDNNTYYLAKNGEQIEGTAITVPTYTGDTETDSLVTITVDDTTHKISAALADTVLTTADIEKNIASYAEVEALASTVGGHVYDIESLQSELAALKELVSTQYIYNGTEISATCGCCHASGQILLKQAEDEEGNLIPTVRVTASGILQNTGYNLALCDKETSTVVEFKGTGSQDFDLSANGVGVYDLYCWFGTESLEEARTEAKYITLEITVSGTSEPSTEPIDPTEPGNDPTEGGSSTEGEGEGENDGGNTNAGGEDTTNTEQTPPTE